MCQGGAFCQKCLLTLPHKPQFITSPPHCEGFLHSAGGYHLHLFQPLALFEFFVGTCGKILDDGNFLSYIGQTVEAVQIVL